MRCRPTDSFSSKLLIILAKDAIFRETITAKYFMNRFIRKQKCFTDTCNSSISQTLNIVMFNNGLWRSSRKTDVRYMYFIRLSAFEPHINIVMFFVFLNTSSFGKDGYVKLYVFN